MTYHFHMNSEYVIYGIFLLLITAAAIYDIYKFTIPNWIVALLIVAFGAVAPFAPVTIDWGSHLGAAAMVLVAGMILHRFSLFGAGDAKLLSAVALWVGLKYLPIVVLYIGLTGGGLALTVVLLRIMFEMYLPGVSTAVIARALSGRTKLPYGVAISLGAFLATHNIPAPGLLY